MAALLCAYKLGDYTSKLEFLRSESAPVNNRRTGKEAQGNAGPLCLKAAALSAELEDGVLNRPSAVAWGKSTQPLCSSIASV